MNETPDFPLESQSSPNGKFVVPAVILVAAFLVSGLDSQSFPLSNVLLLSVIQRFFQFGPEHNLPPYVPLLLQFAAVLIAVGVFFFIGLKADFRRYRLLTVLCFAGALAANTFGYYVASTEFGGGSSAWGSGFGFVNSLGTPEPSGILDVLSAAIGSFLFPVAGFVIGQVGRNDWSASDVKGAFSLGGERTSVRPFVVAGFLIAAMALPLSNLVYRYLTAPPPPVIAYTGGPWFWPSIASGYIGFLVYPVLLILTFFLLGRKSGFNRVDLRKFGGPIIAAGIVGLLLGLFLNLYPDYASGYPNVYTLSNTAELILTAVVGGISVFLLGLASASLGILGRTGSGSLPTSWSTRGYVPVFLAVLTIALVSLATVAAVSYASVVPQSTCVYQPGNALYLRVVTDQGGSGVAGLDVSGSLVSLCPVVFSCTGPCNPIFQTSTIKTLGQWGFVTNTSGYVTVPRTMLGGSAFWFTLTSTGHTYLARYQICGGGITIGQLNLPSGAISGKEIPANNQTVVGSKIEQNGTQILSGCGASAFSGNATIS